MRFASAVIRSQTNKNNARALGSLRQIDRLAAFRLAGHGHVVAINAFVRKANLIDVRVNGDLLAVAAGLFARHNGDRALFQLQNGTKYVAANRNKFALTSRFRIIATTSFFALVFSVSCCGFSAVPPATLSGISTVDAEITGERASRKRESCKQRAFATRTRKRAPKIKKAFKAAAS